MLPRRAISVALAVLLVAGAAAAREPGEQIKPGFNLFSKEQDVQLGREASKQVLQQYQPVQNQFLQNYLNQIGQRLASTPEARKSGFPFNFTLLNDKSVNAFALPGGPMFVFTGLLNEADNEAEVAGVMAHEMSHVILRHGTNQASKANLIQLPAMLAGMAAGGSMMGQLAQLGIGLGANSVLLKFSRTAEEQADALGAKMMSEAGYNPIEMARFFEKLEGEGGSRGPQFLSSHPNPGNRSKAVQAEIRALPQRNYGFSTGEFEQAKAQLGSLPAPAKSNADRSAVQPPSSGPSGEWQQFGGQTFTVSYPGNWQTFGGGDSVTIAPREGIVQDNSGATSIGYGAILSYYVPARQTNLRQATDELIDRLRQQNPTMEIARSARSVRVGGAQGLITMMRSSSPYGGAETDAVVTVARPEGLFYMVFIAPERQFGNLEGAFNQMIKSIKFSS